ncbi:MAG TPA: hypothetical protein VFG23_03715, partial [Polyangia bacterium]|nr:hypothetical protein [Polyangia bacterium]
ERRGLRPLKLFADSADGTYQGEKRSSWCLLQLPAMGIGESTIKTLRRDGVSKAVIRSSASSSATSCVNDVSWRDPAWFWSVW